MTYEDFKKFCLDFVEDPVNRGITVGQAYNDAKQLQGQTVQAFASELARYEDQLPTYSEEHLVLHMFVKLRADIRDALVRMEKIPATRRELVAVASRVETHARSNRSGAAEKMVSGNSNHKKRARSPPPATPRQGNASSAPARSQSNRVGGPPIVTCYDCGAEGHYAPQCPKRKDARIRRIGAEGSVHLPEPLISAKGAAQGLPSHSRKGKGRSSRSSRR